MITVTNDDREEARSAMVVGYDNCKSYRPGSREINPALLCDCDLGAIDGCKARVEAIAQAIAAARKPS